MQFSNFDGLNLSELFCRKFVSPKIWVKISNFNLPLPPPTTFNKPRSLVYNYTIFYRQLL